MSMIQCPKCSAWMDENGSCPECGSALPDAQAQPGVHRVQIATDIKSRFLELNGKKILIVVIVDVVLTVCIIMALWGRHFSSLLSDDKSGSARPTAEECEAKYDWMEDQACWWRSNGWSKGVSGSLKDGLRRNYKYIREQCSHLNRCPRKVTNPNRVLPDWQAMKSVEMNIPDTDRRMPHFCQVKAASRGRDPHASFDQYSENEDIRLYVENLYENKHSIWLMVNGVENKTGSIETSGVVKDSYIFYGIDEMRPHDFKVGSDPHKIFLGGDALYQQLITADRLNVVFAVTDSKGEHGKNAAIIAYRVFALDTMDDVCSGNAWRMQSSMSQ